MAHFWERLQKLATDLAFDYQPELGDLAQTLINEVPDYVEGAARGRARYLLGIVIHDGWTKDDFYIAHASEMNRIRAGEDSAPLTPDHSADWVSAELQKVVDIAGPGTDSPPVETCLVTLLQVAMELEEDEGEARKLAKSWTGGGDRKLTAGLSARGKRGNADLFNVDELLGHFEAQSYFSPGETATIRDRLRNPVSLPEDEPCTPAYKKRTPA